MRGASLTSLLDQLRAATRRSLNPAHNNQTRDTDVLLLRAKQEELWEAYPWPHLEVDRYLQLQTGQRYYGPPAADLRIDRVLAIEVKYGGVWTPLHYGIGAAQFSTWDSQLDERSWPVERWQIAEDEEIEVWPIPGDTGTIADYEGYLKVRGIKNLSQLVDDADTADLDDKLLVWSVAAEQLASAEDKAAQAMFDKAAARLRKVTGNLTPRRTFKLFGGQSTSARQLRGPPRVYYRTTS